nr:Abi family protein [Aerococcus sp. HMSC062A02]
MKFLNEHNYYVKLTAYKTNFPKHNNKYVGLDFKALKDLSTIDMYLKRWILSTSLSVEHALKVSLLKDIQERGVDEYEIVSDYRHSSEKLFKEIENRRKTVYVRKLLKKFEHPNYPVWVFLEVISFGAFVNFYRYYCQKYSCGEFEYELLYKVKNIRNAAAHNNCVIHDLVNKRGYFHENLADRLENLLDDIKRKTIQNRLKNNSVQDFIALLIAVDVVIKSNDLKRHLLEEIKELFDGRMVRDAYLYKSSPSLCQMYDFCKIIIDKLQI